MVSGVYIFKPLLDEIAANQAERKRREALEAANGTAQLPSNTPETKK